MPKSLPVIALIPARAGSRGLPEKNVGTVAGKPLIHWTLQAATDARIVNRIVVTTNDPKVVDACAGFDCEVIIRPEHLSTDSSSADQVIQHFLDCEVTDGILVYLQPTSPLRNSADIDAVVKMLISSNADGVVSVVEAEQNPEWMYRISSNGKIRPILPTTITHRRQDLDSAYLLNGAIYAGYVAALRKCERFLDLKLLAYIMPRANSVDIDNLEDLERAEKRLTELNSPPLSFSDKTSSDECIT